MTIDNYTKFIMTIIAGALVVIALKGTGLIPTANAHSGGVHKIAICDKNGTFCAEVGRKGLFVDDNSWLWVQV